MRTFAIKSALAGKEKELKMFKRKMINAHVAFDKQCYTEENFKYVHGDYLDGKLESVQGNLDNIPLEVAEKVLSDAGLDVKKDFFKDIFIGEVDEIYPYYDYPEMWQQIIQLGEEDFFIAIISLIIHYESPDKLSEFYQKRAREVVRECDLLDILISETPQQVFVAMWFDVSMNNARKAIRKAVERYGLQAVFIDEKEHTKLIVPEIFSEIRKSCFVIADLTKNRGGVYYEAGYAEGLGKQVILTCKNKDRKKIHFDVAQKNTIFWDDEGELEKRLSSLISEIIVKASLGFVD